MTVVLMESFDKYPTGAGGIGGPAFTVNGWVCDENNGGISSSTPRTGTRCIGTAAGDAVHKVLPATYGELIHGCGVRFTLGTAGNFFSLREVASGVSHVILALDGSGHLIAKHGSGSPVYGTSTLAFVGSTWYWLEMRVKVDDTVGTIEVRVGGDPWIGPLTGQDTRNGGAGYIDRVHYVASYGVGFDDIVVIDPTVGTPNDFIGDSRVECIFPNGNGASSQLLGSDGNSVDNYALVDEMPHNSDTDYVASTTVGEKDTYAYPNVSLVSGVVHAVQTTAVAKKSSAGTRKYVHVNRLSGGTEEDSAEFNLADSYVYDSNLKHTKPGGGAWSIADVNGAEFGVKVSS